MPTLLHHMGLNIYLSASMAKFTPIELRTFKIENIVETANER